MTTRPQINISTSTGVTSNQRSTIAFMNYDTGENIVIKTNGGVHVKGDEPSVTKKRSRSQNEEMKNPRPYKKQKQHDVIDLTNSGEIKIVARSTPDGPKKKRSNQKQPADRRKTLTLKKKTTESPEKKKKKSPKVVREKKEPKKKIFTKETMGTDLSKEPKRAKKAPARKYPKRKTAAEKRMEAADMALARELSGQFDLETYLNDNTVAEEDVLPPYEELLMLSSHVNITASQVSTMMRDNVVALKWSPTMDNKQCPICITNFEPEEPVVNTPCFHTYHHECIEEWFKCSPKCPVCKNDCKNLTNQ